MFIIFLLPSFVVLAIGIGKQPLDIWPFLLEKEQFLSRKFFFALYLVLATMVTSVLQVGFIDIELINCISLCRISNSDYLGEKVKLLFIPSAKLFSYLVLSRDDQQI